MTHGDLVNRLLLAVSPFGLAYKNATGVARTDDRILRYGLPGSSDIYLILAPRGEFVAIEAKVGNDQWRPKQRKFAAAVEAAGGRYLLARSKDNTGDDAVDYILGALS